MLSSRPSRKENLVETTSAQTGRRSAKRSGTAVRGSSSLRNIWNTARVAKEPNGAGAERQMVSFHGRLSSSEFKRTIVRLLGVSTEPIKRIDDAQCLLGLLDAHASPPDELLLHLAREGEVVDAVTKVVLVTALEVRYEVVHVHSVGLEGAPRREVKVADDFVHADLASDIAALI